jgi:hypothetical protein
MRAYRAGSSGESPVARRPGQSARSDLSTPSRRHLHCPDRSDLTCPSATKPARAVCLLTGFRLAVHVRLPQSVHVHHHASQRPCTGRGLRMYRAPNRWFAGSSRASVTSCGSHPIPRSTVGSPDHQPITGQSPARPPVTIQSPADHQGRSEPRYAASVAWVARLSVAIAASAYLHATERETPARRLGGARETPGARLRGQPEAGGAQVAVETPERRPRDARDRDVHFRLHLPMGGRGGTSWSAGSRRGGRLGPGRTD